MFCLSTIERSLGQLKQKEELGKGLYCVGGHDTHVVWPACANLPGAHAVHAVALDEAEMKPAGQSKQGVLATLLYLPAAHEVQFNPWASLYFPATQGLHGGTELMSHTHPSTQSLHTVAPWPSLNFPTPQNPQLIAAGTLLALPMGQSVQVMGAATLV